MTLEEIKELVLQYIQASLAGGTIENPKLDFKRQWYKLDEADGIAEFLIDTSSIVNTLGKDGFIIIGYDEKKKEFHHSPFSECKLRDNSDIMKMIAKNVEAIFTLNTYEVEYESHLLSVIHIPPSNALPHVIKYYKKGGKDFEQVIFTRKNAAKHRANKYDLELMFSYREYMIPEYLVLTSFHIEGLDLRTSTHSQGPTYLGFHYYITMDFENLGRRAVSITQVTFDLSIYEDPSLYEKQRLSFLWPMSR